MRELGLYIHIPFCKRKCNYCDFVSYAGQKNLIREYINALCKEIENVKDENYVVKTVYIGGGTPSYIESKYIEQIIEKIKTKFCVQAQEITIEVNPGTVDKQKLQTYYDIGANRLSIGMQSTSNSVLKLIGRIHTYEEFKECYNTARQVGFKNINIDLIFATPNQTIENVKQDVKNLIELNPEHISTYSLILEEGTYLFDNKDKFVFPQEETERRNVLVYKTRVRKTWIYTL